MAASSDKTFWGFLFWVKNNPYTNLEAITWAELYEMAVQFAYANTSSQTITAVTKTANSFDVNEGFPIVDFSSDIYFPKKGTTTRYAAANSGVAPSTTLAANKAACEQSLYPNRHLGA